MEVKYQLDSPAALISTKETLVSVEWETGWPQDNLDAFEKRKIYFYKDFKFVLSETVRIFTLI